jgi:hypothetical protein
MSASPRLFGSGGGVMRRKARRSLPVISTGSHIWVNHGYLKMLVFVKPEPQDSRNVKSLAATETSGGAKERENA